MQARRRLPNILVLSIDIGTSATRSALFDENANRLESTSSSQPCRVCHTSDGGAELPLQVVLRAAKILIVAVGCSGFWHSLLGVDRRGAPLTPIYTWGDAPLRDRCGAISLSIRGTNHFISALVACCALLFDQQNSASCAGQSHQCFLESLAGFRPRSLLSRNS